MDERSESDEMNVPTELHTGDVLEYIVPADVTKERLDRWLAQQLGDASSRSAVQKWIRDGHITTDENSTRLLPSRQIQAGEIYRLRVPERIPLDYEPVDQNIRILYNDDAIALIVKPAGIPVHPGPGERRLSLLNGLMFSFPELREFPDTFRPGIVHRLDRDTEGILLIAKTEFALRRLSQQFKERKVGKLYRAWLHGVPGNPERRIELPIERHPVHRTRMKVATAGHGRMAVTEYSISRIGKNSAGNSFTLVQLRIETGRTHQIRVHMKELGNPVIGDTLYAKERRQFVNSGLMLQAMALRFTHPVDERTMEFHLDPPEHFLKFERGLLRIETIAAPQGFNDSE